MTQSINSNIKINNDSKFVTRTSQRRIHNSVKDLRWSDFQKKFTAKSRSLFLRNASC